MYPFLGLPRNLHLPELRMASHTQLSNLSNSLKLVVDESKIRWEQFLGAHLYTGENTAKMKYFFTVVPFL